MYQNIVKMGEEKKVVRKTVLLKAIITYNQQPL